MKGFLKGMCITAAALMMLGIVLTICGTAIGGTFIGVNIDDNGVHFRDYRGRDYGFGWNNNTSNHQIEDVYSYRKESGNVQNRSHTVTPKEDITSLDFELGGAKVDIKTGSEFKLTYNKAYSCNSRVENGTWIVEMGNMRHGGVYDNNANVTITIPKNAKFKNMDLSMGAGKIDMDTITTETCSLELGAGEMTANDFICTGDADISVGAAMLTLKGELCGDTYLEVGMGSAELEVAKASDCGFKLEMGLGSATIFGKNYAGIAEMSENADAKQFFDIECGVGSVNIKAI
ncbi:MAG: hypothetical protein RR349_04770 [Oscillospiraceae bacterium]